MGSDEHGKPAEGDQTNPFSGEELKCLGPFAPPDDYQFEEELQDEPPRPIPAELRRGRYAKRARLTAWAFLVVGVLSMATGMLPVVKFCGLFVLPLKYLTWIGVGCAAAAAFGFLSNLVRRGPYRYVEEGVPIVARVCSLVLGPTAIVNGEPASYGFAASIQYRDPESGEVVFAETKSNPFSTSFKDRLTTSYHVGDYVTAVYLKSDPAKSLRLYGFLDLKPGLGLIERDATDETGIVKSLLLVVVVFGIFAVLGWNIYAYGRYEPLEMTFRQGVLPFVVGAIVLGGGVLGGWSMKGSASEENGTRGMPRPWPPAKPSKWTPPASRAGSAATAC